MKPYTLTIKLIALALLKVDSEKEKSFEVYTKEIVKHRGGSWVRNTEPLPGFGSISFNISESLYDLEILFDPK